jgi:nucleoid-associated protein YgaU
MARETKVGLLVGLGFIACFAIILENRGRRENRVPQPPQELVSRGRADAQVVTPNAPVESARQYTANSRQHIPVADPLPNETPEEPAPRNARTASHRPAAEVERAADQPGTGFAESMDSMVEIDRFQRGARSTRSAGPSGAELLANASADLARNNGALTAQQPRQNPEPIKPPAPPAEPVQYVEVAKGDSLSRIASRHYSAGGKDVIDAIFQANRDQLKTPNDIREGQRLILPRVNGVNMVQGEMAAKPKEQKPPKAAKPAETRRQADESKYRYYQVKKGEVLTTIAKEQLGTSSRWKEIAELNREIFPDPAKIQYGVRIRLPAESGSDGGGRL